MNVDIKNKAENILLSRIEVDAEMSFKGTATPSTESVRNGAAKALEVDKDLVVVKQIDTLYGESKANIKVYQYFSKDERDRLEPSLVAEEKKAAEEAAKKSAEEKKEAPAEEKKEE